MYNLPVDLLNYISKYSYLIIIFVIIQGSLVFILFYLFLERLLASRNRKKEEEQVKQEAYEEASELLDRARSDSLELLEQTRVKAETVLLSFTATGQEIKNTYESKIKDMYELHIQEMNLVSKQCLNNYDKYLDIVKNEHNEQLNKHLNMFKDELLPIIRSMADTIRKTTVEEDRDIRNRSEVAYKEIKEELQKYKASEMEKTDHIIFQILSDVSKSTIGNILDLDKHQGMIIHILDEAKRENKLKL